ncbi:hypothetical protein PR048_010387 [Dryococelus australis]|uniref:Uncharacterized protein n=1 Tax=Dryococelus australis TaxID=614101 RepID=A0ABQ9I2M3_9NEOP|nr:hypothetical protein PR048_010387 [Dryococelus australis]
MNDVMKDVTRIVNLIRDGNRAQIHRKLVEFLNELSAEFHHVPLHSEIRSFPNKHYRTSRHPQIKHGQYVIELREEFEKRFSDFDDMKTIFQLFADPIAVIIEDQDPELQIELCEFQSDILLSF